MVKGLYSATICCFSEVDTDDILMGCKGQGECLCTHQQFCLAAKEEKFEVGMLKEGICGIGLPCCKYVLKKPEVLTLSEQKCLCFRSASAFPFKEPVPAPVCAICFFSLLPEVGFMKPAPAGPPLVNSEMERP